MTAPAPLDLLRPRRRILGASAVLLPFDDDGQPDAGAFASLVRRTLEAGLVPAVNMDTGYGSRLSPRQRRDLLTLAWGEVAGAGGGTGPTGAADLSLIAGAYVEDKAGDPWNPAGTGEALAEVASLGAVPVVFPSYGLASLAPDELVEAFRWIGQRCERFIAFELGEMFHPAGRIWDLDTYSAIMAIPSCIGAKHSSLRRELEWDRLRRRDAERPDFVVFTGNDLAIDMVMYGSDYLLGLSTFAPEAFAARDRLWESGDAAFYELNDLLQYLGQFAFRAPVPAYRHDAAMFFELRGWAGSDVTPPGVPRRPGSDRAVLVDILQRLGEWA